MEFPIQVSTDRPVSIRAAAGKYDMREHLAPRRLTMAMWDQAYLMRHIPGGSFADYDRVLDEAVERGYNTLRLDPICHVIDLARPEKVIAWDDPHLPYMPWGMNAGGSGPLGSWQIEFMEKLLQRKLHYTLSCWWFTDPQLGPKPQRIPKTHVEAAEIWGDFLTQWQKRFGFEHLVYVDIANEVPYFLPGYVQRLKDELGLDWGGGEPFTEAQCRFVRDDLNRAMAGLRREFPAVRFTASIHGDVRWFDIGAEFDCLDVHFFSDADGRWLQRTRFHDLLAGGGGISQWPMFRDPAGYRGFSDRCRTTWQTVGPMLRARQRQKLAAFAAWAELRGMPLTTSEGWASWFYVDHPDIDWGWLLDWATQTVDDAIEYKMWGWTPHNYVQPQFANWKDARWHQRLTEKFLKS